MRSYQGSFSSGELSSSLLGRVDLGKYQSGCKNLTNMLIHPQGGASKRPGFEMVAELPSNAHLLPFIFNNEQSYVLAFTDNELRVFTKNGLVQKSEHGAWHDNKWKNQNDKIVDLPQAGSNQGQFSIKVYPEIEYAASASSSMIVSVSNLAKFKLSIEGDPVQVAINVYATNSASTTPPLYSYSWSLDLGKKELSFIANSDSIFTERRIQVTLSSTGKSTIRKISIANKGAFISWSGPWENIPDENSSISFFGPTSMDLSGEFSPLLTESLTNRIHIENPGVSLPIEINISTGKLYVQVGSEPGESDILSSTYYEAGLHRLTFNPTSEALYFTFTAHDLEGAKFSPGYLLLDSNESIILNTPYTLEQARSISYAQSADVLFLACRGIAPQQLKRFSHDTWELVPMTFECPIEPPANLSATKTGNGGSSLITPYTYVVTAVDDNNNESYAGAGFKIDGPASNNWKAGDRIQLSWSAASYAVEYRIYKSSYGGQAGYVSATKDLTYEDANVQAVSSDGPPLWTNPFPDNDYPGIVGMFEQRLVFASSNKRPQTIWLSRSGDYNNFSASRPIKAEDSIEATIASSEVSVAQWMISLRSLILGTTNVEWEISSTDGVFSAKSMKVAPQSYRGSAALPALVVGNSILHVARNGSEVRDLKYDFGSDSYGGSDRSILANHLLAGYNLTQWVYQPAPNSIVWAARNDGVLLGLTYQAEHEIFAWHKHTTRGKFCSLCCIPQKNHDFLYAVVERKNGYFLEMMSLPFSAQTVRLAGTEQNPLTAAVYLDSALEYIGEPSTVLHGLDHLEGYEVSILADGAVMAPRKVINGSIKLDAPASRVKVGLGFPAQLETMPLEIMSDRGSSMARKKRIIAVDILLHDTISAAVGLKFDRLNHIKWRNIEPMNSPLTPDNKWHHVNLAGLAENMTTICIESCDPLPLTVLAISPEFDVK